MAEELPAPSPAPSPAPAVEPAPVEATAPAVVDAPVETVVETPVEPVVEPKTPETPKSFLDELDQAEEPKPETAEAQPEPVQKPVYEKFKAPENLAFSDADHEAYTELLGAHGITQEAGQALLDRYAAELNRNVMAERSRQHEVFAATVKNWQQDVRNDPVLGGAQFDTSIRRANDVVKRFAGTPEERKELLAVLRFTGAANHKAMVRFMNNIERAVRAPEIVAPGGRAMPDTNTKAGKIGALYSHPSNRTAG